MTPKQKRATAITAAAILLLFAGLAILWIGVTWEASVGVFLAVWATNLMKSYAKDLL